MTTHLQADIIEGLRRGVLLALAVLAVVTPPLVQSGFGSGKAPLVDGQAPVRLVAHQPRFADFDMQEPSADARHLADWVADSSDNGQHGFVIIDKKDAKAYVFDANAVLRASTPVLLGAARGDESVPGIGSRPIPDVKPEERTTPAGRFVAEPGRNAFGEDVVWVDYDAAVSMHRVRTTTPEERRLHRLASTSIADNRISYGCINVPVDFYNAYIQPIFAARKGVVYVLPEVKSMQQVFGAYDVARLHRPSARPTAPSLAVASMKLVLHAGEL